MRAEEISESWKGTLGEKKGRKKPEKQGDEGAQPIRSGKKVSWRSDVNISKDQAQREGVHGKHAAPCEWRIDARWPYEKSRWPYKKENRSTWTSTRTGRNTW